MVTATIPMNTNGQAAGGRKRAQSPGTQAVEKQGSHEIRLRIEKRLKVEGRIMLHNTPAGWMIETTAHDSKSKDDHEQGRNYLLKDDPDPAGTATRIAFGILCDWLHGRSTTAGQTEMYRLSEVMEQLALQYSQIAGCTAVEAQKQIFYRDADVPETEEQAAAKEAAVDRQEMEISPVTVTGEQTVSGNGRITHGPEKQGNRQGKKSPPVAEKKPEAPVPADLAGELRQVKIRDIVPSPDNPRQFFDDSALAELAESFQTHGILLPILVWRREDGQLEIIDGERRYRAAKLAKLAAIPVRILQVTQQQAIELRGIANLHREDLTPLEEAAWMMQLIERCGYSQRDLAKRISKSQGHINVRLALLDLPDDWQAVVNHREITPTHARSLTEWNSRPAVLQRALEDFKKDQQNRQRMKLDPVTTKEFDKLVLEAVRKCSRSTAQSEYRSDGCPFRVTDKNREALDIQEVPHAWSGGKEKRAFNLPLYKQLADEARRKQKEKAAAEKKASPGTGGKPKQPQKPAYDNHAVERARKAWFLTRFAEALEKLPKSDHLTIWRTAVLAWAGEMCQDMDVGELLIAFGCKGKQREWRLGPLWDHAKSMELPALEAGIRQALVAAFRRNAEGAYSSDFLEEPQLSEFAGTLGIDYAAEFTPTAEILNLYDDKTLFGLPAAERLADEAREKDPTFKSLEKSVGRTDLIHSLVETWQPGEFPPGMEPPTVKKAKSKRK